MLFFYPAKSEVGKCKTKQTDVPFTCLSTEALLPPDHTLQVIRPLVNAALSEPVTLAFAALLLRWPRLDCVGETARALVKVFYDVRSERELREQVKSNMLFRWFIGLSMESPVWDVTVFTKNRDRLLAGDVAVAFPLSMVGDPALKRVLFHEHLLADRTLVIALAELARGSAVARQPS